MGKSEYQKMFEAENDYFWFVAKQRLVERMVGRLGLPKDPVILDLGCGTGVNLKNLEKFGFALGLDYFAEAFQYCARRNCRSLVTATQEILPFRDADLDLVVSLDTIEHTEAPGKMIAEIFRTLKPGGYLLITVPAYQPLYSRHDHALGHKLRYRKRGLAELVTGRGFELKRSGHFYGLVFPAALGLKVLQKFFGSQTETIPYYLPFPLNQILRALCRLEVWLFPYFRLPFGTTLVFLCQKPV